jgi:hypothetical protein
VPIVLKSGSLTLLEHSGSVQTCNGSALPFTAYFTEDTKKGTWVEDICIYIILNYKKLKGRGGFGE